MSGVIMLSLKPLADGQFEKVWAPCNEADTNLRGIGVERGARALVKRAYAEQVPVTKKEAAFDEVFNNPGPQFRRVAFSMQTALKDRNDYVAVGRKLLLTDELPQGEIPAYDLDIPEFGAVMIGARGAAPVIEHNIERITIPTFPITVTSPVKYEDIQVRRFPVFDRAKERVAISNAIAEDDQVFSLLKRAVAVGPNSQVAITGPMQRADMVLMMGHLLSRQLAPGAFVMHPMRYTDIQSWNADQLDQVSLNKIVETGMFGVVHGVRLIMSTRMSASQVYLTTTPDKLGRIPKQRLGRSEAILN